MPCSDVTEVIEVRLDTSDQVSWYRLRKRTCGGSLGMPSLIKDWAVGKSIEKILAASPDEFLASQTIRTMTGELIHLKHFFALRKTLQAYTGVNSESDESFIDSMIYSADGTELIATIPVTVISDEIKACSGCGSCGSKMVSDATH